jgi:hypothetical protein
MSGRERINKANERADQSAAAAEMKVNNLQDLEAELATQLIAIDDKWKAAADAVETTSITLAKTDISVRMMSLIWVPV